MPHATPMTYRNLGRCGTKVSVYGLGGWLTYGGSLTEERAVRRILLSAYEAGINFFDSADVYAKGACEQIMGQVLRELPRHELVISSKVFFPMSQHVNDRGLSRKHIMESVERSLKRMGLDYLDIYFCHRFDLEAPLDETVCAMDDLVRQGKILYWGTSEWTGQQLRDVHDLCNSSRLYRPQVEQPQYSLLARRKFEKDVRPAAQELGMGVVIWSPLAMGILTGKYDAGMSKDSRMAHEEWLREGRYTEENLERVRRFKSLADECRCSRAQLALAWVAAQEGVSSVILGATKIEQLQENLGSLKVAMEKSLRDRLELLFAIPTT